MKTYLGSGDIALRHLNFVTRWRRVSASRPGRFTIRYTLRRWLGGRATEPVWRKGRREKKSRLLLGIEPWSSSP